MIEIDLSKGKNGGMGGDVGILSTEYGVVTEYFYRLFVGADPRNKKIFWEIVSSAEKRALKNLEKPKINVYDKNKKE